jgi:iron complex transport system substrate-binding protein
VKRKKMKKKTLVLIGIAICTILLASPVLASADTARIHIYGDANDDDTLDMRDVTYIKLVIFGKKPVTTLSDANYDGKISMLDIGQAKLIILGKEKELTLIDQTDRTVTINKPIERVVTMFPTSTRAIMSLGLVDKIVGMDSSDHSYAYTDFLKVFPGEKIPDVGSVFEPNAEFILSLKPDVVFAYTGSSSYLDTYKEFQEKTGIPVIGYSSGATYDHMFGAIKDMTKVLGKEKMAEELISYANEKIEEVTEVTSEMPDSEKPNVLFLRASITRPGVVHESIDLAGGINVARECTGRNVEISKEQIIEWNPDIILIHCSSSTCKREDSSLVCRLNVEDVLSDPVLQTVNAVKTHKVYYTQGAFNLVGADYPRVITELLYMATLFHPDEFENLDLEKEGNEVFERFYGVDGLWTEIGGYLGFIE